MIYIYLLFILDLAGIAYGNACVHRTCGGGFGTVDCDGDTPRGNTCSRWNTYVRCVGYECGISSISIPKLYFNCLLKCQMDDHNNGTIAPGVKLKSLDIGPGVPDPVVPVSGPIVPGSEAHGPVYLGENKVSPGVDSIGPGAIPDDCYCIYPHHISCTNDIPVDRTCAHWNEYVNCMRHVCDVPDPQPFFNMRACLLKCNSPKAVGSYIFPLVLAAIFCIINLR
ncbi:hypothetical protein Ddc_19234 [Ditylenchus destructor]|nr:hypothetical protein Ddc_19234 [Ditylenchus destructor]